MPPSRPTAPELLEAVRGFLEREVLPGLPADRRFQCRVAINVLATVQRELELGPVFVAQEHERLVALLGESGPLDEMNRRLARAIRDGAVGAESAELIEHLRRSLVEAVQINHPKWLEEPR